MSTAAAPPAPPLPPLDAAGRERLKVLSEELRCLVCQNQTLADSNAELAIDLRNQVHELLAAGKSNAEIKRYMVERYGDFVLYRPPVQGNTAVLWGGPFALLAAGGLIWGLVQRRSRLASQASRQSSAGTPHPPLAPVSSPASGTTGSPASGATGSPASGATGSPASGATAPPATAPDSPQLAHARRLLND